MNYDLYQRIMSNRQEYWFYCSRTWTVYVCNEVRDFGAEVNLYNAHTFESEYVPRQHLDCLLPWQSQVAESGENAFKATFKKWRDYRRPIEEHRQKLQAETDQLLDELNSRIPLFSQEQRHRIQIQLCGLEYKGVRTPEENEKNRRHRFARCWNCHNYLDNYRNFECRTCGWILCRCGACGCGNVQSFFPCPRCGIKFRRLDCRGSYPFCSPTCRFVALAEYGEYLKSDAWKERRRLRLIRDNFICQDCQSIANEVHHLTYERLGSEKLEDLVSLCSMCHAIRHGESAKKVDLAANLLLALGG